MAPRVRLVSSFDVSAMTLGDRFAAAGDAVLAVGHRGEAHEILVIFGNLARQHIAVRILGHHPNITLVRVARLPRKLLHWFHLEPVRTPSTLPMVGWRLFAVLRRLRGRVVVQSSLIIA